MILIALLCSVAAFALFAASTDEHHQKRLGGRPTAARKARLRIGAWIAIVACFVSAVAARGWIYGPVTWFGLLMLGAGAVFLSLNLIPAGQIARPSKRDMP